MSAPWYDPQGVEKTRRGVGDATPTVPASNTNVTNQTGQHVFVAITGGTVTAVKVDGKPLAAATNTGSNRTNSPRTSGAHSASAALSSAPCSTASSACSTSTTGSNGSRSDIGRHQPDTTTVPWLAAASVPARSRR